MNLEFDFPQNMSEAIQGFLEDMEADMREVIKKPPTKPNMIAHTISWHHTIKELQTIIKNNL